MRGSVFPAMLLALLLPPAFASAEEMKAPDAPASTAPAPPPKFELGPCQEPKKNSGPDFRKIDSARRKKQWDTLIELDKASVRAGCEVPARWERLFLDLVAAGRSSDAAAVLALVPNHKVMLPRAVIANAGEAFLSSPEFLESEAGRELAPKLAADEEAFARAKLRLAELKPEEKPANPFRRKGACPFECCQFGDWKADARTKLVDKIEGVKVVGEVRKGDDVTAVSGEVIVEPKPYAVLETHGELKAGDILWVLDNVGEGEMNIWFQGKENPPLDGLTDAVAFLFYDECQSNGQNECWLRALEKDKKHRNDWWVQIQTKKGKTGWTKNHRHFFGKDACG